MKKYKIEDVSIDDNEPFDGMDTTFIDLIGYSQNLEEMFSKAIKDSDFPTSVKKDAKSALKGRADNSFRMADDVGDKVIKKLESLLNKFRSWCNEKFTETNNGRD